MTTTCAFTIGLGVTLNLLFGCSSRPSSWIADDLLAALQTADDLERARRFDEAREKLAAITANVDGELADTVSLRLCAMWTLEGKKEEGRRCYNGSVAALATDEARALAAHRAAVIALDQDDRKAARAELLAVIESWPYTDAAGGSMRTLSAMRREEAGPTAEADTLLGLASSVAERTASDAGVLDLYLEALLGAGRIRFVHGSIREAAQILGHAHSVSAKSRWNDDIAIWRARALGALGRPHDALEIYESIIDDRESSWFVGSYESAHFDDALFEKAETLLALRAPDAARTAYLEVLKRAPASRLVDDAAFAVAQLAAEEGDTQPARQFIVTYRESRHIPAARELLKREREQ
ncbi:MAG: hypothetical protein A2289_27065 [Deltaproteobacteria bacterium RIFOXYA12_FULL_58_15]|nr:MAG: hypothetical protein A2289_27065 [Deltaproteobacteria bacterium RIFOXYA12_FULL_58_15]OGR09194.1 MAG: hypothetical protein A2341_24475 [Deltaproteobacteria bacterium RIFOXYB12_FULL_58_9]